MHTMRVSVVDPMLIEWWVITCKKDGGTFFEIYIAAYTVQTYRFTVY